MEAGNCALKPGKSLRTASTTCTVFASGWRCTSKVIERSPLKLPAVLVDWKLSSTSATSFSRTGWPLRVATMSSAKSAAFIICGLPWMVSVWLGPSRMPSGEFVFEARRAWASSSIVRLRAFIRSARARTRTAKRFWPFTLTWATPGKVDRLGAIRFSA